VTIVYDFQAFQLQRRGGISRYVVEIARELASAHAVRVVAPLHVNRCLRDEPAVPRSGLYLGSLAHGLSPFADALNRWASRAALARIKPDVLHETYYARRPLSPRRRPVVITVYDMIHELYPDLYPDDDTAARKAAAVERADHILCISRTTQEDLIRILGVDRGKTTVTYLGCAWDGAPDHVGPSPCRRPYLLFVGDRGAHKNFRTLLAAFAASGRLRKDFTLVCFGAAFTVSERAAMTALGLTADDVEHARGPDRRLREYYRHATMLIVPSRYEGFGLTPIEAMTLGCPVVASRGGSLPEILGRAAEYFDADSAGDLGDAIERVADSVEKQAELRALGRERAARYTWASCAAKTLEAYRRLG
jgi:glycosyltransferase involved in cell wall biosynthesis